jgi:hypothetical protein
MAAKGDFAAGLGRVEPLSGLEPLTIGVHKAHQCDRDVEQLACETRDAVETLLGLRVQYPQALQAPKSDGFIRRIVGFLHGIRPPWPKQPPWRFCRRIHKLTRNPVWRGRHSRSVTRHAVARRARAPPFGHPPGYLRHRPEVTLLSDNMPAPVRSRPQVGKPTAGKWVS